MMAGKVLMVVPPLGAAALVAILVSRHLVVFRLRTLTCGLWDAHLFCFSADHFVRRRRDSVSTLQLGCRDSVPVVVQFGGTTLRALADWASQPRWGAPGWQSACILIADQMLLISKEKLIVLRTRRVRAS